MNDRGESLHAEALRKKEVSKKAEKYETRKDGKRLKKKTI